MNSIHVRIYKNGNNDTVNLEFLSKRISMLNFQTDMVFSAMVVPKNTKFFYNFQIYQPETTGCWKVLQKL